VLIAQFWLGKQQVFLIKIHLLIIFHKDKIRIQSSLFEGIYFILIEVQRILSEMSQKQNKGLN